jgi:aryl carrier-like protein
LFSHALVVGSDRPQLGLILFLRALPTSATSDTLKQTISSLLEEVNASSPSFAQISQDMCVVISDADRAAALPKSSKGTVQRGVAYGVFGREIKTLYGEAADGGAEQEGAPRRTLHEVKEVVRRLVRDVGEGKCRLAELDDETDLFGWGVDSLMATRLRARILKVRHAYSDMRRYAEWQG